MIADIYRTRKITTAALIAMRVDAGHCNARLARVTHSVNLGATVETQRTRVNRDIADVLARGQPFTRQDVMEWTGRSETGADSLVEIMIGRGLVVRDGERKQAHIFRATGAEE